MFSVMGVAGGLMGALITATNELVGGMLYEDAAAAAFSCSLDGLMFICADTYTDTIMCVPYHLQLFKVRRNFVPRTRPFR